MFTVGAIGIMVRKTVDMASALSDMAARTGIGVEELQRMDRAARDNGKTIDDLASFWERLASAREKALRKPDKEQAIAFRRFGIGETELRNEDAQQLTRRIAVAFQNSTNVEELIAPLRELGGRGAGELVAFFRNML